ncbi:extracellular solute-binding protein [Thermobifida fusca]|nr:extracellular solute-binding protein [Thermobifida fusca]
MREVRRIAAAAAALAVLAAAACEVEEDRIIYLATGRDVSGNNLYLSLIQEWNRAHQKEGYRAYLVELPGSADEQYAEMVRDAQSGSPEYDIINIDNQFIAMFAEAGWIKEIGPGWAEANGFPDADGTALLEGTFREKLIRSVTYEDEAYAVPFTADVGMLYYRRDLVGQGSLTAGRTFHEILAELADAAEGTDVDHLYIGQFAQYEGFMVNTMEIVAGEQGRLIVPGEQRLADIHRNGAEHQALNLIAASFEDGTFHPAALDSNEEEAYVRFLSGETVAMRNWPIWYRRLLIASTENDSGHASEYAVEALPGAVLGGQSLALAAETPHEEAALDLIRFLTGEEQQQLLFYCGGYAPTRQDIYVNKLSPEQAAQLCASYEITGEDAWHNQANQLLDTIRVAIDDAQLRPVTPYYSQFSEEVFSGLHPMFADALHGAVPLDAKRLAQVYTAADRALDGG